jgi:hypothetical protein
MPLRFATEPQNGSALVQSNIGRLLQRPQGAPPALHSQAIANLKLKSPHAIYDLRADQIAEGHGLEAAHPTGFRYLVAASSGAVAAAEVHTDAGGAAKLVANVNFGPFVEATERALTKLAALPQVATGTYEARLLRISSVQVLAVWLKSDGAGGDIVYPLAPAPSVLNAETPYAPQDFLAALVPIAKKRVANTGNSVP